MNDIWFYENHTPGYEVRWKITDILHNEKSDYQQISIMETVEFGRVMILDGALQVSDKDEYIYHEMIAHVPLNTHPAPEKILIIGGGDGGTLREVLKHQQVKSVDLIEIDRRVVELSKEYFPSMAGSFADPRANVQYADGVKYLEECSKQYDVIIIDSSDPVGPAIQLFSREFYKNTYKALNSSGILAVQSESPIFYPQVFADTVRNIRTVYDNAFVYLTTVPTYVSGPWSFTIGSKKYDPSILSSDRRQINGLKYYNDKVHQSAFALPQYIIEMLR